MNKNLAIAVVVLVAVLGIWFMSNRQPAENMPADTTVPTESMGDAASPAAATPLKKPVLQPSYSRTARDTKGVTTVTYSDKGFSPFLVEVKLGETVRFVNTSSRALWVTSYAHPTAKDQYYPGFDTGKSLPKGASWSFNFTQKGAWGYKNLNYERDLGAVVVTE